jgi:dienelactone hydrolase
LVVLHGDHETADDAARRWREPALAQGWAVLALQCPDCPEQSWYRWNGDPQWVLDNIERVVRQVSIDPQRIYLAGWSGGATYIGSHVPRWVDHIAAVVFHGGGQPPRPARCPSGELPAYFLVGDQNLAHPAARRLRSYFERCKLEHRWDLLPGADHTQEDRALDAQKAAAILGWLSRHRA